MIWFLVVEKLDEFGENLVKVVENSHKVVKKFWEINNENFV
ncbi:hypothetical protein cce_1515 [Crocosphaera subtropica ATCC 51142]|uniref:Uncharacterized protein n=1 Tax=Crocosphaera subtropica (strain ATCC 51142 / BH68) TaxID=43989 RepID=B1WXC1_CROS5|nr:hypothetical protein cce_1515 [Crocosphaera subtropica ATCC 51142]